MRNIIEEIGSFIFVEDKPQKSDVIIAVGGSLPQIAEKAAELYNGGFAPYVMANGGYSVKLGHFKGVGDKADIYNGDYRTECDFYTDVLVKNGVPEKAVIREDKSGHTRENAEFAAAAAKENGLEVRRIIVVCKRFHARRCLMFYRSAFHGSEVLIVPADIENSEMNITRENWHSSAYGIKRVLGELSRCGNQFDENDINNFKL